MSNPRSYLPFIGSLGPLDLLRSCRAGRFRPVICRPTSHRTFLKASNNILIKRGISGHRKPGCRRFGARKAQANIDCCRRSFTPHLFRFNGGLVTPTNLGYYIGRYNMSIQPILCVKSYRRDIVSGSLCRAVRAGRVDGRGQAIGGSHCRREVIGNSTLTFSTLTLSPGFRRGCSGGWCRVRRCPCMPRG